MTAPPTWHECEQHFLLHLRGSNLRRFLREVCGLSYDLNREDQRAGWQRDPVRVADFLRAAIVDWLLRLEGLFSEGQIYAIARHAPADAWADTLKDASLESDLLPLLLDIADYRYVAYTGCTELYDAREGVHVADMPRTAITHFCFDATAACLRLEERLAHIRKAEEQDVPSSPEDSGRDPQPGAQQAQ